MIIAMLSEARQEQINAVCGLIERYELKPVVLPGGDRVAIGIASAIPADLRPTLTEQISAMPGVDQVAQVSRPYKLASREFHAASTVVQVGQVAVGGGKLTMMAGPCAVESDQQMDASAKAVSAAGGEVLRGGAFKPRSSPYSFQGLGEEGVRLLVAAARTHGLKSVCEVLDESDVDKCLEVDILQIGARNMQNYRLLTSVGRTGKPVIIKRGMSATIDEWLLSAEYVLCQNNPNVILCERGMHPIDKKYTRYTLDVGSIPVVKHLSHLPVIVDPSHAAGDWRYVTALGLAGVAAGADGMIVEIHPDPAAALCDGPQALKPDVFAKLSEQAFALSRCLAASTETPAAPR